MTGIEQLKYMVDHDTNCVWTCYSCILNIKNHCELLAIKKQTDEPSIDILKRLLFKEYLKKVIGNDKN